MHCDTDDFFESFNIVKERTQATNQEVNDFENLIHVSEEKFSLFRYRPYDDDQHRQTVPRYQTVPYAAERKAQKEKV